MSDDYLLTRAIDDFANKTSENSFASKFLSQSQNITKIYESLSMCLWELSHARDLNLASELIRKIIVRYDIIISFDNNNKNKALLDYFSFFVKPTTTIFFETDKERSLVLRKLILAIEEQKQYQILEKIDKELGTYFETYNDIPAAKYLFELIVDKRLICAHTMNQIKKMTNQVPTLSIDPNDEEGKYLSEQMEKLRLDILAQNEHEKHQKHAQSIIDLPTYNEFKNPIQRLGDEKKLFVPSKEREAEIRKKLQNEELARLEQIRLNLLSKEGDKPIAYPERREVEYGSFAKKSPNSEITMEFINGSRPLTRDEIYNQLIKKQAVNEKIPASFGFETQEIKPNLKYHSEILAKKPIEVEIKKPKELEPNSNLDSHLSTSEYEIDINMDSDHLEDNYSNTTGANKKQIIKPLKLIKHKRVKKLNDKNIIELSEKLDFIEIANYIINKVADIKKSKTKRVDKLILEQVKASTEMLSLNQDLFKNLTVPEMYLLKDLNNELTWFYLTYRNSLDNDELWTILDTVSHLLKAREHEDDFKIELNNASDELLILNQQDLFDKTFNVEEFIKSPHLEASKWLINFETIVDPKSVTDSTSFVNCPFNCIVDSKSAHVCNNITFELLKSTKAFDTFNNNENSRKVFNVFRDLMKNVPQNQKMILQTIVENIIVNGGNNNLIYSSFFILDSMLSLFLFNIVRRLANKYNLTKQFEKEFAEQILSIDLNINKINLKDLFKFAIGKSSYIREQEKDKDILNISIVGKLEETGLMQEAKQLINFFESARILTFRQSYRTVSKLQFNIGLNLGSKDKLFHIDISNDIDDYKGLIFQELMLLCAGTNM